jgi:hypothetical protein
MSSMAKIFHSENLTYTPFVMDFSTVDIMDELKNKVGNDHGSKLPNLLIELF